MRTKDLHLRVLFVTTVAAEAIMLVIAQLLLPVLRAHRKEDPKEDILPHQWHPKGDSKDLEKLETKGIKVVAPKADHRNL